MRWPRKPAIRRVVVTAAKACLPVVAAAAIACGPKDETYFGPREFTQPPGPVDLTPPVIRNLQPPGNVVLNDSEICFEALDLPGLGGEPASGLNIPGFTATSSTGTALPIRAATAPNTYIIDITLLPEGLSSVSLQVPDLAGNRASSSFTFRKDVTAPTLTANVPATGSTTQPSSLIDVSGLFADQHGFGPSSMFVRQAVNNQCAVDGPLFPTGSGAGTVGQNPYSLGTAGQFNFGVNLNGAPNELRPRTTTYCFHFLVADPAVNKFSTSRPNITERLYRMDYTWAPMPLPLGDIAGRVTLNGITPLSGVTVTTAGSTTTTNANGQYAFTGLNEGTYAVTLSNLPAGVVCVPISKSALVQAGQTTTIDFNCTQSDYSITLQVTYVHVGPGLSYVCVRITVTEIAFNASKPVPLAAITGASWTASWSGPGVVGQTQRSGAFDANNQALDRQQINLFGTYTTNVLVTANGVTKQASGSVTVGGTQGTCPPP